MYDVGCEKLGVSHEGCTVVDERDGTIIEDYNVLLALKGKTFILLGDSDQWTPAKQSAPYKAEPIDVQPARLSTNAASASSKVAEDNTTPSSSVKIHFSKTDDFIAFCNELHLVNRCDLDKITRVAHSLVSLDISAEQWNVLWASKTFLEFISNCAAHPPAAMHVATLLRCNEIVQKLAPKSVRIKYGVAQNGSNAQDEASKQHVPAASLRQGTCSVSQTINVTQPEYYRISVILPKPEVHDTQLLGFYGKVLPYVLQRVKMRGCFVLYPSRFSALVRSQDTTASNAPEIDPFSNESVPGIAENKQHACPVSRLDCLTCLFGTVDSIVARDLLRVMSQFTMAFPLVMRDIAIEGKYKLMTPLLRGIVVKWENASGNIIEHSLFNDPFKLLVAVRLGQNDTGKSAILNQVLAKENTFSSRVEPGSKYGKPATVDGSVEFVWLTQETCKDTLWTPVVSQQYSGKDNTINLLANLHGDANENSDIIALLNHCFQCRYLAFVMPNCTKTHWECFLSIIPTEDHVKIIRVDPADYNDRKPGDIRSSRIVEDKTLQKVKSRIDEALAGCSVAQSVNMASQCPRVSMYEGIETELSQGIVDFVVRNTCKLTKGHLQLQAAKSGKYTEWRRNTTPHDVLRQFINILLSPTDVMQRAVIHLEDELSRLCCKEMQKVRSDLLQLKTDLRKAKVNVHSNSKDADRIRRNVTDTLKILDGINLGLEHFFREVGYLYQLQLQNKTKSDILMLPSKVADLFLNGHPIELLDGDAGDVQMLWLNDIFNSVVEKYPNLRVYVISIIGLQSSGKSTLLNALFACRFAVSVGRCTRGLFMRLLFVDSEVSKACNVDAVLLIDTEGLGSIEKMGDTEAERTDRLLATFAMGISNLTIVNVLGEYPKELTEILQTAVVTVTRLEKADIAPDILMVQHLLTEKNAEKLSQGEEQFCEAIWNVIDLADKKDMQLGVRNAKCLRLLFDRIQKGTLLTQFHPYKDGATVNAPASEAYHNDVISLYETILRCCKSSGTIIEFKKWKTLFECYWECVTQEDFALRFKNVKEILDFIDRGKRIAEVRQAIEAAFSAHARESKQHIAAYVQKLQDRITAQVQKDFLEELENRIKCLPHGCAIDGIKKCKECKAACEKQESLYEYVQDGPYEMETKSTIANFTEVARKSTIRKLSQSFDAIVMQQGCCVKFDNIITDHLKKHLSESAAGRFSDERRKVIIDKIFEELRKIARVEDCDMSVREKISDAILYEYPQKADMLDRFNGEVRGIEDIVEKRQGVRNFLQLAGNQRTMEIDYLKSMIESLIRKMLEQRHAECYEDGMVSELSHRLTDMLDSFSAEKRRLTAKSKLDIHVWTLQQFCKRMEDMQAAWDKKNKLSSILEENKERYIQIINARLVEGETANACSK